MSDAEGSRTPEERALAGEIEHTRQQLGETVEALAAKADVKGRARHRATRVAGSLRGTARAAKDTTTGQAAVIVRGRRGKLAAAAAVLILAWLAMRSRRG